MPRHFRHDGDLTQAEQREVLELAISMKMNRLGTRPLEGPKAVAVIFDKSSTRTRVSFSVGITELGGYPLVIDAQGSQMGRGESIEDTTRVLERQCAAIVWRTFGQANINDMAAIATVPVVNALTDTFHPCQILADLQTIAEHRGGVVSLPGTRLTFIGDGNNNMANSYLIGGATAGLHVRIAAPTGFQPVGAIVEQAAAIAKVTGGSVEVTDDVASAITGAHVVATDAWTSMGQESEKAARMAALAPYQLNEALLAQAEPGAIVLHCLPAYRGQELTAGVIDGPQSVVWDEAENRLHAQKALLTWLLARS